MFYTLKLTFQFPDQRPKGKNYFQDRSQLLPNDFKSGDITGLNNFSLQLDFVNSFTFDVIYLYYRSVGMSPAQISSVFGPNDQVISHRD